MTTEEEAPRGMWRFAAALRHRDYRRFWIASTFAGAGVWALIVARGWLAYEESGSSLSVGLVTFAAMAPFIIIPPFAGLLADRMDRRILVSIAHSTNVVLALGLAGFTYWGDVQLWHLVLFSLLSGIARGVQMPSNTALVATLVPRSDLLNAIALNAVPLRGARLIGPFLAGIILATFGISGAFILAAGMYALAAVQIMRVNLPASDGAAKKVGLWADLTAGFVYAYRNRSIGLLLALVAFHCGLTMAFESIMPAYSEVELDAGGVGFSYLVMATGAGALIGVFAIAPIREDRTKGRLLFITGVLSGVSVVALGFATSMPIALAAAVAMGATQGPFMTLSTALYQSVVPDEIRGRLSSLFGMSALSLMALANLGYGTLADYIGPGTILLVPGTLFIVVVAIFVATQARVRRIFTAGMPPVAAPLATEASAS